MTDEVRSVSSTGAEKGVKLAAVDLLPTGPLLKIAEHFGRGAKKYSAHNWRAGYEWSKSYAALQRHLLAFWGGEDIDEETGSPHLAAAGFHVLALLEYMETHPEFDDRYKSESREAATEVDPPAEPKPLVVLPPETVLYEVTGPRVYSQGDPNVDLHLGDIVHILEDEDFEGDVWVEVISGSDPGTRQYIVKTSLTPTFDVRR